MFGEIAIDRGLEGDDAEKCAASQPALGQGCEEAFDGVEAGGAGRGEVEGDLRVAGEPGNLRALVGGVAVEDDVHGFGDRGGLLDGVEERMNS